METSACLERGRIKLQFKLVIEPIYTLDITNNTISLIDAGKQITPNGESTVVGSWSPFSKHSDQGRMHISLTKDKLIKLNNKWYGLINWKAILYLMQMSRGDGNIAISYKGITRMINAKWILNTGELHYLRNSIGWGLYPVTLFGFTIKG